MNNKPEMQLFLEVEWNKHIFLYLLLHQFWPDVSENVHMEIEL